jgi:hypothetical protein
LRRISIIELRTLWKQSDHCKQNTGAIPKGVTMGATSVTGTGMGDEHPGIKGPGNGRNVFKPLLAANVVAADSLVLVGGAGTVTFPTPLDGGHAMYVIMLTGEDSTAPYVSAKADDGGAFVSFDVAGGATDTVHWTVIKKGRA